MENNISEETKKIMCFLEAHELISVRRLEKKLYLPLSTIGKCKLGRNLPKKFLEAIKLELSNYGFKK